MQCGIGYGGGVNDPVNVPSAKRGDRLLGSGGRAIGAVDAVFADYLLVRTGGLLPVDLYAAVQDALRFAFGLDSLG